MPAVVQPQPAAASVRPVSASVLDLGGLGGLDEEQARLRLREEGPNEIPEEKRRTLLAIVFEVVRQPMFLLLIAAGSLYLMTGEPGDALMLFAFVFVVMGITVVQERRTERALEALRDLSSPRALVIRGGARRRIAGREVVRGDLVVLVEGDRVPADALLRRGLSLSTDESLLTGESVPVRKRPSDSASELDAPGGDDLPSVFSGSLVTAGQGVAEVVATGARSQLGRIGKSLGAVSPEPTLLQKETGRMVRTFAIVGLAACALVVVAYATTRGGAAAAWKQGLLAGIAMAMAVLPEEFPVVLTVFLALGAWRISKSRVLTRRMPAVETLGAATVLCVDKTGTLTQNRMALRRLAVKELSLDVARLNGPLPEEVHGLLESAILASKPDPFDPMERALHRAGADLLKGTEHLHPDWSLAREYPLRPELLAVSHVWHARAHGAMVVAAKGAPEAVADLCHLGAESRAAVADRTAELASQGLRVLGVARGAIADPDLPPDPHDFTFEYLGLLGFEDPLRPGVPAAVAECNAAGIRVVMITGDYPATAQSIARQAGLADTADVLAGPELRTMSHEELAARVRRTNVFARIVPEQKLLLVEALKANDEIVAMTGDGVNDAPALKAAHIGIAMGGRGTDVARESASLVLLDDDFSSIVTAVRVGRRIFDNIKKAIAFIVAVHIPIAGLSMLPVFFGDWPLLLLPVQIVFLELVIDPSCTLVFEAEEGEADLMQRPPRRHDERLFSRGTLGASSLQGLSVLVACVAVFLLARRDHTADAARTLTFTALVVAFLGVIVVNRSWTRPGIALLRRRNAAFAWVNGGTLAVLAVVLFVPAARELFHFAALPATGLALSAAIGAGSALWLDVRKLRRRRRRR